MTIIQQDASTCRILFRCVVPSEAISKERLPPHLGQLVIGVEPPTSWPRTRFIRILRFSTTCYLLLRSATYQKTVEGRVTPSELLVGTKLRTLLTRPWALPVMRGVGYGSVDCAIAVAQIHIAPPRPASTMRFHDFVSSYNTPFAVKLSRAVPAIAT